MSKKNMYMTIDTETVGGASTPTGAYNYGGVIHDKIGHIYATFSILVMEHYDEIAKDDYAKRNFPIYRERLDRGDITAVASEDDAVQIIRNLCRFYHVNYVMAYNTGFDFCKTKCKELLDEFEFIDIYLMALQTITHLKSYRQFCIDHEKWSASGKTCSTTAESVFGFINQNAQYVEEHTALNDALIEMAIFTRCAAMKKRYAKNVHMWDCKERNKCFPKRQNMVRARLMEKLGCSEAEAMDIIASDKRIDKGEKLFELPKEKQEVAKKMARAERAPTAYKFTQRKRKPNNGKRNLISMLAKFLDPHVDEKVEITNEEREINFKMQGVKYRIVLSCPRK